MAHQEQDLAGLLLAHHVGHELAAPPQGRRADLGAGLAEPPGGVGEREVAVDVQFVAAADAPPAHLGDDGRAVVAHGAAQVGNRLAQHGG